MWNLERIHADNELIKEYGLKNMKELWKVQSDLSRIRGNVRELLSGNATNPEIERNMISSLAKFGIVTQEATLDNLLDLKPNAILERRLQSQVFRKGMARTMKQARQLITHGFISISGKRANRPGMMVSVAAEGGIAYYKPIDITVADAAPKKKASQEAEAEPESTAPVPAPTAEGAAETVPVQESGNTESPAEAEKSE